MSEKLEFLCAFIYFCICLLHNIHTTNKGRERFSRNSRFSRTCGASRIHGSTWTKRIKGRISDKLSFLCLLLMDFVSSLWSLSPVVVNWPEMVVNCATLCDAFRNTTSRISKINYELHSFKGQYWVWWTNGTKRQSGNTIALK